MDASKRNGGFKKFLVQRGANERGANASSLPPTEPGDSPSSNSVKSQIFTFTGRGRCNDDPMEQKNSDHETHPTSSVGNGRPSTVGATCSSSDNSSFASTIDPTITSVHPSTKRTFDWQLLPQEELDRIAYNSHKQRKARLKVLLDQS